MLTTNLLVVCLISISIRQIFSSSCSITQFDQVSEIVEKCSVIEIVNLTVPGGESLKLNLTDGAVVTFKGKTTFEFKHPWKGPLVTINGTEVTVQAEKDHIFDGQGQYYWDDLGDWGVEKPQFFTVQTFGNSIVKDFHVVNVPHDVLQVTNSDRTSYTGWIINNTAGDPGVAPEGNVARNTDGFDIWNSTNIVIAHSVVYNQDDCVAVRCGSNITVHDMECHNTHGLSISVGFSNLSDHQNPLNTLKNVYFSDSMLYGGTNIIHIKTHNEGGFGLIENVTYDNIYGSGTGEYGILIEQNYPSHGTPLDNVPIKKLRLKNVFARVLSNATGISVVCADGGCEEWEWENIDILGSSKNNTCNYKPSGTNVCD